MYGIYFCKVFIQVRYLGITCKEEGRRGREVA